VNHTGSNSQKQPRTSVVAIIPARYHSTRLPGKVLSKIAGKPMIVWVAERASAAERVKRVIVATDDPRVSDVVRLHGYEVVSTSPNHESGTDRLAEVMAGLDDVEIVVNVQGDEPLISPLTIDAAVAALEANSFAGIATTWEKIETADDVLNPSVVKVVVAGDNRAIYFSRAAVPFPRELVAQHGSLGRALQQEPNLITSFKKHTGLYVYRREVLLAFSTWPRSPLEKLEELEQLRAVENGITIMAVEAMTRSVGVDTVADLQRVEAIIAETTETLNKK
jgi:3-deoxy-manno-octulosonate cytidylyltransferase (CMP-KDO synthetase)